MGMADSFATLLGTAVEGILAQASWPQRCPGSQVLVDLLLGFRLSRARCELATQSAAPPARPHPHHPFCRSELSWWPSMG